MDEMKLRSIRHSVEDKSEVIDKIVASIVAKYTADLEDEINRAKRMLEEKDKLEDFELENLVMRVPVFMYFAADGVESLGVEADLAKAVKLEVYNDKYVKTEGTVAFREAEAGNATMHEAMIEVAFNRAYRKLKDKITMAEHVFSGAKKVLSKRMQDNDLAGKDI